MVKVYDPLLELCRLTCCFQRALADFGGRRRTSIYGVFEFQLSIERVKITFEALVFILCSS